MSQIETGCHSGATLPNLDEDARSRFFALVDQDPTSCWRWLGGVGGSGYGNFIVRYADKWRSRAAHRISFFLFTGINPRGRIVAHTCDNRTCVNPYHLFLTDNSGNMADMAKKGRMPTKLTNDEVLEIRASNLSQNEIARKYRINQALVSRIKSLKERKYA